MRLRTYLSVAFATTLNVILNALTYGRFVWLEGRVRGGVFQNWARRFRYRPRRFERPTSQQQIVELVRNSERVRVFGSAHSFNGGFVSEETLLSLDDFSGVLSIDRERKQMTVKGGTRVRDIVDALFREGWAFRALPSHDAQSIAGIISTDVHGTGGSWGFVSEFVVGLTIVDGRGEVHTCAPSDELFKAAIGGVGAVGVITEVVLQATERFNVDQRVYMSDLDSVKRHFDKLLTKNDHFSLYLFPFTKKCQVNTWNWTNMRRSRLGDVREFISISVDALLAAWFGNFMAYTGLLRNFSNQAYAVKRGSNLVLESNKAFNRTIYHAHQELEFTVPFEETFETCERFVELFERMYGSGELPYTLFEVRFTPAGHDRTLLGAGRDRRSTWIDLVCNDSAGFEKYYAAAEELIREVGARPHLGKFCERLDRNDLARLHGDNFEKFLGLVKQYDPAGKFSNDFTRRMFG
ncbi:MAG TPA: D-arabinono-1,4-lactone oxidase [Pyrinomonadaceae bacterium]|nr:D-arabinono-1,4-lactone oxidase [Pyrinomonadaceae bacterium]